MTEGASRKPGSVALGFLFFWALLARAFVAYHYTESHPNAEFPAIDERSYDRWGAEIAGGDWLGDEVFFQEPLYPYFLGALYSVTGESDRESARYLQSLLGAVACLFCALTASELLGPRAGLLAGALLAALDTAIVFPSYLLKPNLVLPLLAGLCWLGVRLSKGMGSQKSWLVFGGLVGLGALLRGNMLLLVPFFVAFAAWIGRVDGRAARYSVLVALGIALVLLPVATRNAVVGGQFVLTTSGAGTNLYGGNNADNPNGTAREFDWVRGIPEFEADDWRREAERRTGRELEPGEVSRYWLGEVWKSVRESPGMHLSILWNKLRATLASYEVPDNHDLQWDRRILFKSGQRWLSWGMLGPFVLAGVWLGLTWPKSREQRFLALFFLLYLATIVLTVTSMRVRLALVPIGVPLAAVAAAEVLRDPRSRRAGYWFAVLVVFIGIVRWGGPIDSAEQERRLAVRDYNSMVQRLEADDDLEALHHNAYLLTDKYPDSARFLSLRAETGARLGLQLMDAVDPSSQRQAEMYVQKALTDLQRVATDESLSEKEVFRARRIAGWVQLRLGNGDAAVRHFEAAMEFDDEDSELWLGWIQARLETLEGLSGSALEVARREIRAAIETHLDPNLPAAADLLQRLDGE